jgi:hypothetical protein
VTDTSYPRLVQAGWPGEEPEGIPVGLIPENTTKMTTYKEQPVSPAVTETAQPKKRRRRPTETVRASRVKELGEKLERQRLSRYEEQERGRAPRLQIDTVTMQWVWLAGLAVAFVTAAVVSFDGITAVAAYMKLTQDWMPYLVFFFVELSYLLFLVAYLNLSSLPEEERGGNLRGVTFGMYAFASIAIVANPFKVLVAWDYAWAEPPMYAGMVLSTMAPVAILVLSKLAARVVFARPLRLDDLA